MKKTIKFLGIASASVAFALSLTACGNEVLPFESTVTPTTTSEAAPTTNDVTPTTTNDVTPTTEEGTPTTGTDEEPDVDPEDPKEEIDPVALMNAGLTNAAKEQFTISLDFEAKTKVSNRNFKLKELTGYFDEEDNLVVVFTGTAKDVDEEEDFESTFSFKYVDGDVFLTSIATEDGELHSNRQAYADLVAELNDAVKKFYPMAIKLIEYKLPEEVAEMILSQLPENIEADKGSLHDALVAFKEAVSEEDGSVDVSALAEYLVATEKDNTIEITLDTKKILADFLVVNEAAFKATLTDILEGENEGMIEEIEAEIVKLADTDVAGAIDQLELVTGYTLEEIIAMVEENVNAELPTILEELPEDLAAYITPYLTEDGELDITALVLGLLASEEKTVTAAIKADFGKMKVKELVELLVSMIPHEVDEDAEGSTDETEEEIDYIAYAMGYFDEIREIPVLESVIKLLVFKTAGEEPTELEMAILSSKTGAIKAYVDYVAAKFVPATSFKYVCDKEGKAVSLTYGVTEINEIDFVKAVQESFELETEEVTNPATASYAITYTFYTAKAVTLVDYDEVFWDKLELDEELFATLLKSKYEGATYDEETGVYHAVADYSSSSYTSVYTYDIAPTFTNYVVYITKNDYAYLQVSVEGKATYDFGYEDSLKHENWTMSSMEFEVVFGENGAILPYVKEEEEEPETEETEAEDAKTEDASIETE